MNIVDTIYEDDSAKILWTLNNSLFKKLPKCIRKYITQQQSSCYDISRGDHKNILIIGPPRSGKDSISAKYSEKFARKI